MAKQPAAPTAPGSAIDPSPAPTGGKLKEKLEEKPQKHELRKRGGKKVEEKKAPEAAYIDSGSKPLQAGTDALSSA